MAGSSNIQEKPPDPHLCITLYANTRRQLKMHNLQLRLSLGLLEDRVKLGGLHHVALDLELSGHEESLGVALARDEVAEVLVGEGESDCIGVSWSFVRKGRAVANPCAGPRVSLAYL